MNKFLHIFRFYPLAGLDLARVLFSPFAWRSVCHQACPSVVIPADFFGINVASREEPDYDQYVLERLKELGIKHVRVGYTYSSPGTYAQRFLDLLVEQGYAVTLVLLPEYNAAGALASDRTRQEEWRHFVSGVLARYAGTVEHFEMGSTPNRKKWGGHT
jgi:hypothetical protein